MSKKIQWLVFLTMVLCLGSPCRAWASEAQMESQVGIEFENDYQPDTANSDTIVSPPTGETTPTEMHGTTQSKYPATGETVNPYLTGFGIVFIILTAWLWYQSQRKKRKKEL